MGPDYKEAQRTCQVMDRKRPFRGRSVVIVVHGGVEILFDRGLDRLGSPAYRLADGRFFLVSEPLEDERFRRDVRGFLGTDPDPYAGNVLGPKSLDHRFKAVMAAR